MESTLRRTWAEVNLDTLAYNYETLCKHVGGTSKFVGVVKADAYGHGSVQVCKVLEELGLCSRRSAAISALALPIPKEIPC